MMDWNDPSLWTAVGFVIFVALVAKAVWRGATKALDERAESIRDSLERAAELREDAQKTLAEYKRRHRGAEEEARAILEHAREEAARMGEEAERALEETLGRRERQALAKIAQAEQEALEEVRARAVELSVAAARALISQGLGEGRADELVDEAIREAPSKLR